MTKSVTLLNETDAFARLVYRSGVKMRITANAQTDLDGNFKVCNGRRILSSDYLNRECFVMLHWNYIFYLIS